MSFGNVLSQCLMVLHGFDECPLGHCMNSWVLIGAGSSLLLGAYQRIPGFWLDAKLWNLLLLLSLWLFLRVRLPPIQGNGMMVPALADIVIYLLIRAGTGVSSQNFWVHPYRLNGHSVQSLDPVLELNLLKNLSLRDHDGQAGFGSRDSSQKMSMVMILLLIV